MATQGTGAVESSIELKFRVHDQELFFVRASEETHSRVTLAEMIHRSDGRLLEYFTVKGASPTSVLAMAAESAAIDDARFVRELDGESLYEFTVSGACIGGTLADAGAVVREVVATDGIGHVVADVPPHADGQQVVRTVQESHGAELTARRQLDRPAPAFTCREFRATLIKQLTERQLEALLTAYVEGYFDWPRESTAEECAQALGITQPTFTQHIRSGEYKLLRALFDEQLSIAMNSPPVTKS